MSSAAKARSSTPLCLPPPIPLSIAVIPLDEAIRRTRVHPSHRLGIQPTNEKPRVSNNSHDHPSPPPSPSPSPPPSLVAAAAAARRRPIQKKTHAAAKPTPQQVNIPKSKKAFCKGCKKHQMMKVTQYKTGKASLFAQGKRRYDRKQSGFGGQTKPVFHKKAKTTKKIVLRMQCAECKQSCMKPIKRCKHFELGGAFFPSAAAPGALLVLIFFSRDDGDHGDDDDGLNLECPSRRPRSRPRARRCRFPPGAPRLTVGRASSAPRSEETKKNSPPDPLPPPPSLTTHRRREEDQGPGLLSGTLASACDWRARNHTRPARLAVGGGLRLVFPRGCGARSPARARCSLLPPPPVRPPLFCRAVEGGQGARARAARACARLVIFRACKH